METESGHTHTSMLSYTGLMANSSLTYTFLRNETMMDTGAWATPSLSHPPSQGDCVSLARRELQAKLTSGRVDGPQLPIFLLVIVSSHLDWKRWVCVKRVGGFLQDWEFLTFSGWRNRRSGSHWVRGEDGALLSCSRPPRAQWAEKTEPGEVRSWAPGRRERGVLSFWFAFSLEGTVWVRPALGD